MFVPAHFRPGPDLSTADIVCQYPLAILMSNGDDSTGPLATHVPVIPESDPGEWPQDLAGARLFTHMSRANPHCSALHNGSVAVLAFTGPGAYVSPALYDTTEIAPTWDYVAVHARVVLERIEDRAHALDVMRRTVETLESRFGSGWDMSAALNFFDKMLSAVEVFRATVLDAQGMFKLSQEQPPRTFARVRDDFAARRSTTHQDVAALMKRTSR
ncbi:FMN-binding negative transcriptional regulator [Nocardia pseudobrasiliensis]|uniref:PaiB family negative transcriptional regulator n=1 Tax=Nocardia pseudobrasiliensis TaxID=45979 RepID=A0A370ICE1_9NOCA|nr:FMN-binding negative transcriptional regulator [Nocardia pseudobrasiliensis]RDI68402.1 PaiB family negative transcriptional regulator [Nocardia pseudobrasiliensis]